MLQRQRYEVQILQEAFSSPPLKPEMDKLAELVGKYFSAHFSWGRSSLQGLALGSTLLSRAGLTGFASCSHVLVDIYTLTSPGSMLILFLPLPCGPAQPQEWLPG